jgi:hypothetical protein
MPKSTVHKIADDLAAKSRILRKTATIATQPIDAATDAALTAEIVERLAKLAAEHRGAEAAAHAEKANAARAAYLPLIEQAEKLIADNAAADAEIGPMIRGLSTIDWKGVRARARILPVPGSLEDANTRLALLQRTVDEAAELLRGTDDDLRRYADELKNVSDGGAQVVDYDQWARTAEKAREYYANGVRGAMNARGEMLRAKAGGIRKLLRELAADLDAADAAIAQEAK